MFKMMTHLTKAHRTKHVSSKNLYLSLAVPQKVHYKSCNQTFTEVKANMSHSSFNVE